MGMKLVPCGKGFALGHVKCINFFRSTVKKKEKINHLEIHFNMPKKVSIEGLGEIIDLFLKAKVMWKVHLIDIIFYANALFSRLYK